MAEFTAPVDQFSGGSVNKLNERLRGLVDQTVSTLRQKSSPLSAVTSGH
jgi:hypothetical protein